MSARPEHAVNFYTFFFFFCFNGHFYVSLFHKKHTPRSTLYLKENLQNEMELFSLHN